MNIALVFPPFFFEPMYNMPPLGLVNLATVLENSPHKTKIFDFPLAIRQEKLALGENIYRDCTRRILEFQPEIAGFSVQCTTYPPALRIAEILKKLQPSIRIVFGGHNASFADEATLVRFPWVDDIVRGEGELTFPEYVSAVSGEVSMEGVSGVTFRQGDRIVRNPDRPLIEDLDSLPTSDYTLVPPFSEYRDACGIGRSIAILEIGRGCPHRCIYCSQSLIWKRRARTFSVDRLIGEMQHLARDFGAECFLLAYDQFTAKRGFAEEFCRKVIDSGMNQYPWYCISRLDTVDESLLNLMRRAGCETMCYGIDSGSKKTLAFIRKNIDREVLLQRVRETTSQGIVPTLSFVIGFPEETREDLDQTLELALKSAISGNSNILVQMATTLPGTDLHKDHLASLRRVVDTYFSLGIEFDNGKRFQVDDALIDSSPEIFSSFYNLPCPAAPLDKLNEIASHFTVVATLFPRTFHLLSLESGGSVSAFFLSFLDYAEEKTSERSLSPRACRDLIGPFASKLLDVGAAPRRAYIRDILKYEMCLIDAAATEPPPSAFRIDPAGVRSLKPLKGEKILVQEFPFDIPGLILDFKSGLFPESCPEKAVHLIFQQTRGEIDVREINQFGADFLRLCDGQRSLDAIAGLLYTRYGIGKEREEFAQLCAEAALALADLMLFSQPGPPNPEAEGGEKGCSK